MPNLTDKPALPPSAAELAETLEAGAVRAFILDGAGRVVAFGGEAAARDPHGWTGDAIALRRDADRAVRKIGFSGWDAIVVEADGGMVGIAPRADLLAVVVTPADSGPALARRLALRLAPHVRAP